MRNPPLAFYDICPIIANQVCDIYAYVGAIAHPKKQFDNTSPSLLIPKTKFL